MNVLFSAASVKVVPSPETDPAHVQRIKDYLSTKQKDLDALSDTADVQIRLTDPLVNRVSVINWPKSLPIEERYSLLLEKNVQEAPLESVIDAALSGAKKLEQIVADLKAVREERKKIQKELEDRKKLNDKKLQELDVLRQQKQQELKEALARLKASRKKLISHPFRQVYKGFRAVKNWFKRLLTRVTGSS